jgi:hypothetical protein
VTAHRLAGPFSVDASAKRIRHYRFAEERILRTMGGWIALTPELSAKLLLGRHVWDCAQHADLWGKRLPELRASAQQSEPASEAFVHFMDELASPDAFHQTTERLVGVYRVLKPCLLATYERHLDQANPVYEPPTRRILERCIDEERRHVAAGEAILRHLTTSAELDRRARQWAGHLSAQLAATTGIAGDGVESPAAPPAPTDVPEIARDLVQLEKPVGRFPVPDDLARALHAHARAILARDLDALEQQVVAEARPAAMRAYGELAGARAAAMTVVASARLGREWVVKQRLDGPDGVRVIQARWQRGDDGWQVVDIDVVRREPGPVA